MASTGQGNRYTCNEYRAEMILLSLEQRLHRSDISEEEKQRLKKEIVRIKTEMEMD